MVIGLEEHLFIAGSGSGSMYLAISFFQNNLNFFAAPACLPAHTNISFFRAKLMQTKQLIDCLWSYIWQMKRMQKKTSDKRK